MNSKSLDRGLLLCVFTLLGIGLIQVYSSSFIFADESRGDGLFFFRKQALFSVLGIAAMFCAANIKINWLQKCSWQIWILASLAIAATFLPGIGIRSGGATRWLQLPFGLGFEPSEFLKIALSLVLAGFISHKNQSINAWIFRIVLLAIPLLMMLKQPDFGSVVICVLVALTILYIFGLSWKYILLSSSLFIIGIVVMVISQPYRLRRVIGFLDPWADPTDKGFQIIQSLLSFYSGGLSGVGLGQAQGKLFFLPEAHTDFTLAVFAEETGFIGFLLVMSLYGFLIFRGLQIAVRSTNDFSKILVTGVTVTLGYSIAINSGVSLGLLPPKGLTLPFLSYGGSSLLMSCVAIGLILNVAKQDSISKLTWKRKRW